VASNVSLKLNKDKKNPVQKKIEVRKEKKKVNKVKTLNLSNKKVYRVKK